jgi:hypothetical protein
MDTYLMPFHPTANIPYEPTGGFGDGRALYCVTGKTTYLTPDCKVKIEVPAGYVTDLASIPKLLLLSPKSSLWDDAAIVHDKACDDARDGRITRRQADAVFYHAMRERGCTLFTATVLWTSVRFYSLTQG